MNISKTNLLVVSPREIPTASVLFFCHFSWLTQYIIPTHRPRELTSSKAVQVWFDTGGATSIKHRTNRRWVPQLQVRTVMTCAVGAARSTTDVPPIHDGRLQSERGRPCSELRARLCRESGYNLDACESMKPPLRSEDQYRQPTAKTLAVFAVLLRGADLFWSTVCSPSLLEPLHWLRTAGSCGVHTQGCKALPGGTHEYLHVSPPILISRSHSEY